MVKSILLVLVFLLMFVSTVSAGGEGRYQVVQIGDSSYQIILDTKEGYLWKMYGHKKIRLFYLGKIKTGDKSGELVLQADIAKE